MRAFDIAEEQFEEIGKLYHQYALLRCRLEQRRVTVAQYEKALPFLQKAKAAYQIATELEEVFEGRLMTPDVLLDFLEKEVVEKKASWLKFTDGTSVDGRLVEFSQNSHFLLYKKDELSKRHAIALFNSIKLAIEKGYETLAKVGALIQSVPEEKMEADETFVGDLTSDRVEDFYRFVSTSMHGYRIPFERGVSELDERLKGIQQRFNIPTKQCANKQAPRSVSTRFSASMRQTASRLFSGETFSQAFPLMLEEKESATTIDIQELYEIFPKSVSFELLNAVDSLKALPAISANAKAVKKQLEELAHVRPDDTEINGLMKAVEDIRSQVDRLRSKINMTVYHNKITKLLKTLDQDFSAIKNELKKGEKAPLIVKVVEDHIKKIAEVKVGWELYSDKKSFAFAKTISPFITEVEDAVTELFVSLQNDDANESTPVQINKWEGLPIEVKDNVVGLFGSALINLYKLNYACQCIPRTGIESIKLTKERTVEEENIHDDILMKLRLVSFKQFEDEIEAEKAEDVYLLKVYEEQHHAKKAHFLSEAKKFHEETEQSFQKKLSELSIQSDQLLNQYNQVKEAGITSLEAVISHFKTVLTDGNLHRVESQMQLFRDELNILNINIMESKKTFSNAGQHFLVSNTNRSTGLPGWDTAPSQSQGGDTQESDEGIGRDKLVEQVVTSRTSFDVSQVSIAVGEELSTPPSETEEKDDKARPLLNTVEGESVYVSGPESESSSEESSGRLQTSAAKENEGPITRSAPNGEPKESDEEDSHLSDQSQSTVSLPKPDQQRLEIETPRPSKSCCSLFCCGKSKNKAEKEKLLTEPVKSYN